MLNTTAELKEDKFVINGSKTFITVAREMDLYLFISKVQGAQKLQAFLVQKDKVKLGQKITSLGMKWISWGELVIENAEVPKDNLIIDDAVKFLGVLGRVGILGASAIAYGLAEGAYEEALNHTKK